MECEMVEFLRLFMFFIIYSVFGWVLESVYKTSYEKKWVNSGFLHSPLCPIYGLGAVIMILFLSSFKNNIFLLFIVGIIVLSIWEYFVGWLLETLFHTKYWDYSKNKFNIKGRVCLVNAVIWGLLGVIFIGLIHPLVEPQIIKIPNNYLLCADIIFFIAILTDTIISIVKVTSINNALDRFKELAEKLKERIEELEITKETAIEKIKNIRETIEELKLKQNAINLEFYKKAIRIKKAFPTMKSEKMTAFFEQKIDIKELKKNKIKQKKK